MAKSEGNSPVDLSPESRNSSFTTRKRTNSHLEIQSRTKALKCDPVTSEDNAHCYVSQGDSSAAENGIKDDEQEHEETLSLEQGKGGNDDTEEESEDADKSNIDSMALNRPQPNGDIVHSTLDGNGPQPTNHDGETSDDEGQISSEDSDDSGAGADDPNESEHEEQAETNGEHLLKEKTKKELRRAARREKKLLRAQKALERGKRGKRVRLNGGIMDLPKGGSGFIGLEDYDGEESGKDEGEVSEEEREERGKDEEEEEEEDEDGGLLVGSKGVSASPTPPPQRKRKPDILSSNNDFVPIDIPSDSEADDKDLHTRRLQQKKEKFPDSISGRNAPPIHTVVEISDDEALDPLSASVSSLESGEAIAITAPILTFPPQNPEKTAPRLRLLMQYYTPISPASFPYEEDRDLFGPVRTNEFRISSPKRRKLVDDSPLREFFQRQICGVCATEGHEEKACEKLRCKHCFAWDKHFSHACPEKSLVSAASDSSDEETFNWRRVPPANAPHSVKKAHPTRLNIGCYSCASDHHFGDDCSVSGQRPLSKAPWSMRWVEEMGWIDKNAPPAKAAVRAVERERERERDSGPSSAQNNNQNRGRDSRRDRDARRDQDPYIRLGRGREWDYERDISADIRSGGGGYRSRYGGGQREASPLRSGGYGRDGDRDRNDSGRNNRKRSPPPPPPPPPPRSQLPPLPREPLPSPVGYTGSGGAGGGRRDRRGGVGDGTLEERIRMMPSSGKREWGRFKQ